MADQLLESLNERAIRNVPFELIKLAENEMSPPLRDGLVHFVHERRLADTRVTPDADGNTGTTGRAQNGDKRGAGQGS